jgi:glutaredoxin
MDPMERKILAAFDAPDVGMRAIAEFSDDAGMNDRLQHLIARGWLRCGEAPDTFLRTEEGRLQLAAPHDVTIYSRPGCHLCEEAKKQIAPLLKSCGARLTEINIDEDAELRSHYDYDVPVIFLGARKVAKHKVDLAQFRRQLQEAAALSG